MALDRSTSVKIANLGLVMAVMVVMDHAIGGSVRGGFAWWTMEILSNGVCKVAVPFFFAVSGFFLAGHMEEPGWWRREFGKRLRTLGLPLLFWSTAGALLYLPIARECPWCGWENVFRSIGIYPFGLPTLTPLWYLRALLVLALVSPFLSWAVRKGGMATLAFWYLLSLALSKILAPYGEWNNFFGNFLPVKWGFFWFSLGIWLQRRERGFSCRWKMGLVVFTVGLTMTVASRYMALHGGGAAALSQKLSYPPLLYGIWCLFPAGNRFRMASCSFPIYLIHYIVLWYASYGWPIGGLPGYAYRISGALVISICVTQLMRKYVPRFAAVVFGGR